MQKELQSLQPKTAELDEVGRRILKLSAPITLGNKDLDTVENSDVPD